MSGMFFNMSKGEVQAEYREIIARIRGQLAEMNEAMDKQNNSIMSKGKSRRNIGELLQESAASLRRWMRQWTNRTIAY